MEWRGIAIAVAVTAAVAGCALVQPHATAGPVAPGPLAPVRPNPNGGPPVECRGVPLERCMELAPNMAPAGTVRIIVSCAIALCTPSDGAIRFDTVDGKGTTTEYGNGLYGNAEQP